MKTADFVKKITEVLDIRSFDGVDVSMNGLQVGDLNKDVKKIAFAVDACKATIDEAVKQGADILFVHHGLFWGRPLAVTGTHYERIKALLDNGLGVFACHLPLDAHPEFGNNACMARALSLEEIEPFSLYHGKSIGCKGFLPNALTCEQIVDKLGIRKDEHNVLIKAGKKLSGSVAIVSGSAADDVNDAIEEGIDCFITGESSHSCFHNCIENGINMLCLGHYETETFGVKAVMKYVSESMKLDTCFIDIPTRL